MKPEEQNKTLIVIFGDHTSKPNKPRVNPAIFKATRLIVITTINWLYPEAAIAVLLVKLLFMWLESLNQNEN